MALLLQGLFLFCACFFKNLWYKVDIVGNISLKVGSKNPAFLLT